MNVISFYGIDDTAQALSEEKMGRPAQSVLPQNQQCRCRAAANIYQLLYRNGGGFQEG